MQCHFKEAITQEIMTTKDTKMDPINKGAIEMSIKLTIMEDPTSSEELRTDGIQITNSIITMMIK